MDVKYTLKGPKGRTCGDCANFKADKSSPVKGMCFGHEVAVAGSCNFFKVK